MEYPTALSKKGVIGDIIKVVGPTVIKEIIKPIIKGVNPTDLGTVARFPDSDSYLTPKRKINFPDIDLSNPPKRFKPGTHFSFFRFLSILLIQCL